LFRLLWRDDMRGSVSALARQARLGFSTAHGELEEMRAAGVAVAERAGTELLYRADLDHPESELFRRLAALPDAPAELTRPHDDQVLTWLANVGAPVGLRDPNTPTPPLEHVVSAALSLSHREPAVARVLPVVLWRHRRNMDMAKLAEEATRYDERQALGYFLELAGRLGADAQLRATARSLHDQRRRRFQMFFAGHHGPYEVALTRRNTPPVAKKWGYLMNMPVDSFRSTFEKFADI
jgi:hypothetical protein